MAENITGSWAVTGPNKGVVRFLAKCVSDAKQEALNDGRGTYEFEHAMHDIDNLIPGGLLFQVINTNTQEGWETIINRWLEILIIDHPS